VVESPAKAALRPYHRQKLATVIANLRHFALEQAQRGVAVHHVVARGESYASALEPIAAEKGPLRVMRPAERELREDLAPLVANGVLEEIAHEGWITSAQDFAAAGGPPWRMDRFYRFVRKRTGILMKAGKPEGGRFSFDGENRLPWRGEPRPPTAPIFQPDEVTREVCDLVEERYARHPGVLEAGRLAATAADASRVWAWAKAECLPSFGPFEDAMSTGARGLFHTRISPLLNTLRILAPRVVGEVALLEDVALASREGFIRQILGWREYMHHVHEATDGFRIDPIEGAEVPRASAPGDGGYRAWSGRAWATGAACSGGSLASHLGASNGVPPAYWGLPSGMNCLDQVVRSVWEEAWSHHITRLMVLANIAMLLDLSPRELTDWFWVAYADAYDWVVEPNVHAMGTFGVGDLLTTKPYVAGSGYIHKMSNYCEGCRFHPTRTCPLPPMYWAYLDRHREALATVPRMFLPLRTAAARSASQRQADRAMFERVRDALARGEAIGPESTSGAPASMAVEQLPLGFPRSR